MHEIQAIEEHVVGLNFKGTSRLEFLSNVLEAIEAQRNTQLVWPTTLSTWSLDPSFHITPEMPILIDGNVQGSTEIFHSEMIEQGLCDVSLADLACAHAAFFLVTGEDLFGGNTVRCSGGALHFKGGLLGVPSYVPDPTAGMIVAASKNLSVH